MDEYESEDYEEDISDLEDQPVEEDVSSIAIAADATIVEFAPDTHVYRLRLLYSNETFLAAWTGEVLKRGMMALVPTRYGRDLAQIIGEVKPTGEVVRIERPATVEDLARAEAHHKDEEEAYRICREKIGELGLDMKLVSVHYLLDDPKILFFFTADNRVDFRELVKDLVAVFKSRIELRQIGVRDESRVLGGIGECGRPYCCHAVSDRLKPVSIKMAKDQNLSLNSMKISGPCGRLLCCLSYEHQFYSEQRRLIPNEGNRVSWDGELWRVTEVNVVTSQVKLTAEDGSAVRLPTEAFERVEGRWNVKKGTNITHATTLID
jgi:cell fate regulator YaaT (PSP1 superfamily)